MLSKPWIRCILAALVLHSFVVAQAGCGTPVWQQTLPAVMTAAGSPYCIMGPLTVNGLTIQPGVRIRFMGPFPVTVTTPISANGTAANPIVFETGSGVTGTWTQLTLACSGNSLTHCIFQGATDAALEVTFPNQVIDDCEFRDNSCTRGGGAVRVTLNPGGSTLALRRCLFHRNHATNATGAGALRAVIADHTLLLEDCVFQDNDAQASTGAVGVTVGAGGRLRMIGCEVLCNRANVGFEVRSVYAGGMWVDGDAEIERCTFWSNRAWSMASAAGSSAECRAGGVHLENGDVTIINCVIRDNAATAERRNCGACCGGQTDCFGGGLFYAGGSGRTLTVTNSVIAGNTATCICRQRQCEGGGIYRRSGVVNIVNCTVARNQLVDGARLGAGLRLSTGDTVDSSIVFGNLGAAEIDGGPTQTYSCVRLGPTGGGNIDINPAFISATGTWAGAFLLAPTSPCVDTGNPALSDSIPPGLGRTACDMGAYGGPGAGGWNQSPAPYDLVLLPACRDIGGCQNFRVTQGVPGDYSAVYAWAANGAPLNPPAILTSLFGIHGADGKLDLQVSLPMIPPGLITVSWQAITIDRMGNVSWSPSRDLCFL